MPLAPDTDPAKVLPSSKDTGMRIVTVPLIAELFVGLLFAAGLGFTWREFRRLTAKSQRRKVLVIGGGNVAIYANQSVSTENPSQQPERINEFAASDARFPHADHRSFESSWLARRLESEDWVA